MYNGTTAGADGIVRRQPNLAQLARDAVRADDKDRGAADGRSALDRTFLGIDYPPPTKTQRPEPANAVKRWPPSPADCPPQSSPSTFLLNDRPDVDVWRSLIEYMCGGRGVRRRPGGTCGGYAWMGQALGGGSITHRCKRCPCGGRADARHIICGECTVYQMPPELQEHLANILTQTVVREQAQTGYVPTVQANVVAATVDRAASTLFGSVPPPRTEEGWRSYTRALRVTCGGLPRPDRDMLRAMKQQHEEAHRTDRPASTVAHAATLPQHRLAGATASSTGQPPADDKPSVWKDNPEALKLASLEFRTSVLKES